MLFFRCMAALFDPCHHRGEPIKWGLVSYTVIMFSLVTMQTAVNLDILAISYIDNCKFPGVEDTLPPGPVVHFHPGAQYHFRCYIHLEQLAGRWSFGRFIF